MLTGVSRNTAVLVYERLVAEGYVDSRPRDGFFVGAAITPTQGTRPLPEQPAQPPAWALRLSSSMIAVGCQRSPCATC